MNILFSLFAAFGLSFSLSIHLITLLGIPLPPSNALLMLLGLGAFIIIALAALLEMVRTGIPIPVIWLGNFFRNVPIWGSLLVAFLTLYAFWGYANVRFIEGLTTQEPTQILQLLSMFWVVMYLISTLYFAYCVQPQRSTYHFGSTAHATR